MENEPGAEAADEWTRHMLRGDFEAAWRVSDAVLAARAGQTCWHLPRHMQHIWDGTPLEGRRVLVRCYHGLGDTLQFIRYAPLLRSVAAEVTVWAQAPLIPLLRTVRGTGRLLPLHDGVPEVDYEVDVELMELPHVFRTTLATLPAEVPYIHVEPARRPRSEGLAVGLVWAAGDWDARRSVPFPLLAPLGEVPGVAWYSFQRGAALADWPAGFGVVPDCATLYEEARLMRSLDLLISVDTMTAHLGGALGVPVWTLLQRDADWRWMRGRDDSPWYPTMRLFRQEKAGDWEPVVARVAEELSRLAAGA